ncbi:hypothetical protein JTE90_013390 [Oedothorax gibbosus]|uniref:Uncharacterized protein n=1 Tax=Oedothorax gibbosus TaxID=931172 RepID=A0AAV6TV61_9ARAC|nr:hypothetical protein JTE90_013390 [Oedothorax gibbosus]
MAKFARMDEFVIDSSWISYCQKLTFFFKANSIEDYTQKRNIFLTICGDSTFSIADALLKPATLEDSTFETIKTKLDGHFNPDPNIIVERLNSTNKGVTIVQKYLVKGPTYLECDSTVEHGFQDLDVYLPNHYALLSHTARKHPMPYRSTTPSSRTLDGKNLCLTGPYGQGSEPVIPP